jgi:hypothetical protein
MEERRFAEVAFDANPQRAATSQEGQGCRPQPKADDPGEKRRKDVKQPDLKRGVQLNKILDMSLGRIQRSEWGRNHHHKKKEEKWSV